MEFLSAHFGEILTTACTLGMVLMGSYISIKIALARTEERNIKEKEIRELFQKMEMEARLRLEDKLDRHVENSSLHAHRRDGDPTGYFHVYEGS